MVEPPGASQSATIPFRATALNLMPALDSRLRFHVESRRLRGTRLNRRASIHQADPVVSSVVTREASICATSLALKR